MRQCLLLYCVLLVGCNAGTPKEKSRDFREAFGDSVKLYAEYVLPNSMSRPPGFDLDHHLKEVLQQFETTSAVLHSPEGIEFLDHRLNTERDSVTLICGIHILEESGQPAARAIIQRWTKDSDETVREHASAAIVKLGNVR